MTWFFPTLEDIPVYIRLTGADHGRKYYGNDGRIYKAPPLNHEETVVLKLFPSGDQKMEWFRETIDKSNAKESENKLIQYMNNCRICHYGAMRFKKNPEVIELSEIDKLPKSDILEEIIAIQEKTK